MALTLVRRASAKLPKNNYVFRCDPKYSKLEIREYLEKVYGVSVARVATVNRLGTCAPPWLVSFLSSSFPCALFSICADIFAPLRSRSLAAVPRIPRRRVVGCW